MLTMKPNCECCDRDLDPSGDDAYICSFECTWCTGCADHLGQACPNCGGSLVRRPARDTALLEAFPASSERAVSSRACP
ncbi:MAG: DUF1272 domain-containing protein [Actinomycetes bacterium]